MLIVLYNVVQSLNCFSITMFKLEYYTLNTIIEDLDSYHISASTEYQVLDTWVCNEYQMHRLLKTK